MAFTWEEASKFPNLVGNASPSLGKFSYIPNLPFRPPTRPSILPASHKHCNTTGSGCKECRAVRKIWLATTWRASAKSFAKECSPLVLGFKKVISQRQQFCTFFIAVNCIPSESLLWCCDGRAFCPYTPAKRNDEQPSLLIWEFIQPPPPYPWGLACSYVI